MRRLRSVRFLSVVGTSGSGKSSLVRSGLIPALTSGLMSGAGSSWRVAVMRPGEDPVGHLARAVSDGEVLATIDELAGTSQVIVEATLRRGTLGLVNAVRQARLPAGHNVLVIVDQFEELFRFRRSRRAHSRDEAIAFVRLLLEAAHQHDVPIYVALTMRSDFIGDCMDFPGLPDAVNAGLYLVGRMGRDALRSAITGPVAVGGGRIAPRLVNRVLNDLGDDQDQLPRVQHALMRTWDHWAAHRDGDTPIDVGDYEAIGGFRNALSRHAEEAYGEASELGAARIAERMFKALTDSYSDPRGVRRPTAVDELAAIGEAPEAELIRVIDIFRRAGRSFLMPPPATTLTAHSIVDLSHESLMRCWTRLIAWAGEERDAADFYMRLSRAAAWHAAGTAGLWRDPELQLAEQWRRDAKPTAAWARRYDEGFDAAMAFLDRSLEERERVRAQRERERRATLRRTQWAAGVLATLLLAAVSFGYLAQRERARASANLELARAAVDESLASADRDQTLVAADPPELTAFRRELLEKAEGFYLAFLDQQPQGEQARQDLAEAHINRGHINRMLDRADEALSEYQKAVDGFQQLTAEDPDAAAYRHGLATALHWLGEARRQLAGDDPAAEAAYDRALALQEALAREHPDDPRYEQELARTRYNRGILRYNRGDLEAAEGDFREAIRLLEPLAPAGTEAAQGLARALNNLGSMREFDFGDLVEAEGLYDEATRIGERLLAGDPDNREYRLELAKFYDNLAALLHEESEGAQAAARSERAVELMDELARVVPSVAIERADAHSLLGWILVSQDPAAAERAFRDALFYFGNLDYDEVLLNQPDFHVRFGDFLLNLTDFRASSPAAGERLLSDAVGLYADAAGRVAAAGSASDIRPVLETLTRVLPALRDADRVRLQPLADGLRRRLDDAGEAP